MRLDHRAALPQAVRAMNSLEQVVESSNLEPRLRELVKLRASQLNGCAYCVDMHTKDVSGVFRRAALARLAMTVIRSVDVAEASLVTIRAVR